MKYALKKIGFSLICLLLLIHFSVNAQTLKQTIAQTMRTNPNVLIKIKGWLAAKQGIRRAQGGYLPSLDVNADIGTNHIKDVENDFEYNNLVPRGVDVTLNQMLFDGFATSSEVSRNKNRTLAEKYQVQGTAEDVGLLAIKAYLDVMRTWQIISLAQQNYANHLHTYNMIKRRAARGLSRKADATQAYGRLALAKANLLGAKNNHADAVNIYYKVVGSMPQNLILPQSPKPSDLPLNKQDAVQDATDNHPLLKSANADIAETKAQHRGARATYYPRLDAALIAAEGRDLRGVKGESGNYAAFLQLHYNLFRGGSDLARLRETAFLVQQAEQTRNRTYDQVVENMELAWNGLITSRAQLVYFQQHQAAAKTTVIAYEKQFKLGKRTLFDLLNSEKESFNAQVDYVNGKYSFLFAKFRILNAEGRLLRYMQIFNIQNYLATS